MQREAIKVSKNILILVQHSFYYLSLQSQIIIFLKTWPHQPYRPHWPHQPHLVFRSLIKFSVDPRDTFSSVSGTGSDPDLASYSRKLFKRDACPGKHDSISIATKDRLCNKVWLFLTVFGFSRLRADPIKKFQRRIWLYAVILTNQKSHHQSRDLFKICDGSNSSVE